jgi:hypothetical protein
VLLTLLSLQAQALPPGKAARLVAAARELLGVQYQFGGRLQPDAGIDCLGLLFYAAERVSPCGWRSYSVYPTRLVRRGELGQPVKGLSPVAVEALDVSLLEAGDVVLLLADVPNPGEPALTTLDGGALWVWHTGLATGDGGFIQADLPQVIEGDLKQWLEGTQGAYAALYVLRMRQGPSPSVCRRHAPMRSP